MRRLLRAALTLWRSVTATHASRNGECHPVSHPDAFANWPESISESHRFPALARASERNDSIFPYCYDGFFDAQNGDYARAISSFDKLIALDPTLVAAHFLRGAAYFHIGEFDRAIADYDQAIALDPRNATAYQYLYRGQAYESIGDKEKAIADFRKALSDPSLQESKEALRRLGVTP